MSAAYAIPGAFVSQLPDQSRECQKSDWHRHKSSCKEDAKIYNTLQQEDIKTMERYKSNDKWCDKHTQSLAEAAMSALNLKQLRGRTG